MESRNRVKIEEVLHECSPGGEEKAKEAKTFSNELPTTSCHVQILAAAGGIRLAATPRYPYGNSMKRRYRPVWLQGAETLPYNATATWSGCVLQAFCLLSSSL